MSGAPNPMRLGDAVHKKKWKWSSLDDDEKDFAFGYVRAQIRRLEADLKETNGLLYESVPGSSGIAKRRFNNMIKRVSNEQKKTMGVEGPLPPLPSGYAGGRRRRTARRQKKKRSTRRRV